MYPITAHLKKFYRVLNSIAESPIRRKYLWLLNGGNSFKFSTVKLLCWDYKNHECWTWGRKEFFPSRLFIKELSKKQIAEICLKTFFLVTIAAAVAAAVQLKILLSWRLPFLKDVFEPVRLFYFWILTNSIISFFCSSVLFVVFGPNLFWRQLFRVNRLVIWLNAKVQ